MVNGDTGQLDEHQGGPGGHQDDQQIAVHSHVQFVYRLSQCVTAVTVF